MRKLIVWAAAGVVALCGVVAAVEVFGAYRVPAGPFAGGAACSRALAGLPERLLGRERDAVEGTGAAGWGDGAIVLRCGVRPLAPTIDSCVNVNGVDWVLDDERAQRSGEWVFTTYGRETAVAVAFKGGQVAGDALVVINGSLGHLAQKSRCPGADDAAIG
ncbi:DUF3515 family protein [Streptomyces sp. NPDC059564]|uniref:DUF3515 family protein n=1 Tax=Streptomyces sp. NPDC059564 TaxID=3346865 RepID=UPI0036C1359C